MYYLEDICILCLKNNVELQSVFIQDNDGIAFNEKLKCCFPEIFDSTPDAHKLACLKCIAKLRILYESKESVICNINVMKNYLDKLQCENNTFQQPSVVLAARKRRKKDSNTRNLPEVKVETAGNSFKLKIKNFNLNSTNDELLSTIDHSSQPTANENDAFLTKYNCLTEEKDLETKNVDKVVSDIETGTICIKQEPQFSDGSSTTSFLDKEAKNSKDTETSYIKEEPQFSEDESTVSCFDEEAEDSEGSTSSSEDDPDFEISDEEASSSSDYNNQKVIEDDPDFEMSDEEASNFSDYNNQKVNGTHTLKPLYVSEDSVKFCNTCQELLFKDLNNINVHLQTHVQSSNCFRCEQSLKDIHKFQKHLFNHCETMVEILDKIDGEDVSCVICHQQFDRFSNLQKHIFDEHTASLKCEVCHRTSTQKRNLLRHIMMTHCHVKLYKCTLCPTRFSCPNGIKSHMIYLHYSDKICICKYCKQTFKNGGILREHIAKVHEKILLRENEKRDSSKRFTFKKMYYNHHMIKKHNNGNTGTNTVNNEVNKLIITENHEGFSCEICHIEFDDFEESKKHIYDKHMPILDCVICSASYTRRLTLHRHILEKHCDVKLFKCTICCLQFSREVSLKNHMSRKHNEGTTVEPGTKFPVTLAKGQKVTCTICNKQFDVFEKLRRHIYDEHITDLNCVVCSTATKRRTALNQHIIEQHCGLKVKKCKLCPQRFVCKKMFQDHRNQQHSKDKDDDIIELDNRQKLTCAICQKQFDVFKNLRRHIYEHITDLNCVVCNKTSTRKTHLNRHILLQHCHLKIRNCKHCPQRFISKESLEYHLNQQHSIYRIGARPNLDNYVDTTVELDNKIVPVTLLNGEKVTCTLCNKQFDVYDNLRRHIYDEHITNLDCVVCSKTSTRRSVLNQHILEQHCHIKIIKCKLCPHRFAWKESFKYHMRQEHLSNKVGAVTESENNVGPIAQPEEIFIKEEPYNSDENYSSDEEYEADNYETKKDFSNIAMAEESNSRTSNSYDLEDYIASSVIPIASATSAASYCEPGAPVDQSNVCDICHRMFLYLSNLSEHLNAHMQESSCFMCKDSAENISRLQRHMLTPCGNTNTPQDSASAANTRTNDKVTCVVCQQEFKYIILKKHMYTHITDLTCVICNRTFTIKQNLRRHLLEHCNVKPFQCEVCGKSFTVKYSLKYHMDSAHSSQVVNCPHCQKEIKSQKSLRLHIKTMHPKFMFRCEVCKRIFIYKNDLEKHAKLHTFSQN